MIRQSTGHWTSVVAPQSLDFKLLQSAATSARGAVDRTADIVQRIWRTSARDSENADNIQTLCVQLKGCPHGPCAPWTHLLRTLRHLPPIRISGASLEPYSIKQTNSLSGVIFRYLFPVHRRRSPFLTALFRRPFFPGNGNPLENEKENARHTLALRFFPHAFFPLLVAPCLTNTLIMGHQLTKTIIRGYPLLAGPSMAVYVHMFIGIEP